MQSLGRCVKTSLHFSHLLIVAAGMVFSFFKKRRKRWWPNRPPYRAPERRGCAVGGSEAGLCSQTRRQMRERTTRTLRLSFPISFSARVRPIFQIEGDVDPIDAAIEEAAVLFANGQDDAVRVVLETRCMPRKRHRASACG